MQKPEITHHFYEKPDFITQENYPLLNKIDQYYWPLNVLHTTNNTIVVWKIKYKK